MKYFFCLFILFSSLSQAQVINHKCKAQDSYIIRDQKHIYSGSFNSELDFTFTQTYIESDFGLKKYIKISDEKNNGYFKISSITYDDKDRLSLFGNRNYIYVLEDKYLIQYYYNSGISKLVDGVYDDPYVPYEYEKHPITGYTVYIFDYNIEEELKSFYKK